MSGGEIRSVSWPETATGGIAKAECPCESASLSRRATRVCGGTFTAIGLWEDADYQPCDFTEVAWKLCGTVEVNMLLVTIPWCLLLFGTTTCSPLRLALSVSLHLTQRMWVW